MAANVQRARAAFPALISGTFPLQGMDKFTTSLLVRVEPAGSGGATLRTRVRVEATLFGVQSAPFLCSYVPSYSLPI